MFFSYFPSRRKECDVWRGESSLLKESRPVTPWQIIIVFDDDHAPINSTLSKKAIMQWGKQERALTLSIAPQRERNFCLYVVPFRR